MQSFLRQGQSPHRDPLRKSLEAGGLCPRRQSCGRESLFWNTLPFPKPLSLFLFRAAALLLLFARLFYTSDAAGERFSGGIRGRRII